MSNSNVLKRIRRNRVPVYAVRARPKRAPARFAQRLRERVLGGVQFPDDREWLHVGTLVRRPRSLRHGRLRAGTFKVTRVEVLRDLGLDAQAVQVHGVRVRTRHRHKEEAR